MRARARLQPVRRQRPASMQDQDASSASSSPWLRGVSLHPAFPNLRVWRSLSGVRGAEQSPLLLRLHYGLRMLQLGDRVGMAMDELPDAVLGPEDASAPKGDRRHLLPSPDLRLEPLELDGVAEVIAFDLPEALELDHPAVAIVGCCPVHGLLDLRLAPFRRTEGVRQGRILGIAEQLEEPARVALSDLIQRAVVRLDRLIEALGR